MLHSRVARSNILCLTSLGANVRVVRAACPDACTGSNRFGVRPFTRF
jgi:aspartate carbamoyltransferase catalytic subunit